MKLLLPIEIHVAVCELQATRRPTIAGLLLHNCVIKISLLDGVWDSGAAPAGVHRGAALVLHSMFSKLSTTVVVVISESVVLNEA